MNRILAASFALAIGLFYPALTNNPVSAQELELQELRQRITIFSGVLKNALGLNEKTGLFGTSAGSLNARYLHRQGLLLEIRTPLSVYGRGRNLVNFGERLKYIRIKPVNPFLSARPMALPTSQPSSVEFEQGAAANYYQEISEKIAQFDFPQLIQESLRVANNSARSLRGLGELEEAAFSQTLAELADIQQQVSSKVSELRSFEVEVEDLGNTGANSGASSGINSGKNSGKNSPSAEIVSAWEDTFKALKTGVEPLIARAREMADLLKEQEQLARQEYELQWQRDVAEFETLMFSVVCDYGGTFKGLGENEFLTLVLSNLGAEAQGNDTNDRIHVFSGTDLTACQRGNIDATELRVLASSYSF